jgi:DNA mismatch repair protein MutL
VEEAVQRALGELAAAAPISRGALPFEHRALAVPRLGDERPAAVPRDLFGTEADSGEVALEAPSEAVLEPATPDAQPALRIVGQVHSTYILVETGDGVLIIDQHSAHERVLYERTMQALSGGAAATSQQLLFPLTIELRPEELDALERSADLVRQLGYELEPFGGRSVIVQAVPAPHPRFDAERCLREIVGDLAGGRFGALANRLERFASTFACRAAVKAGQALARPEMEELIARLFDSSLPAHDVHGRPTVVQLPKHELERRFGRH